MAQTISHRAGWDADAESVYRVLVDDEYLRARLRELGGKDPALTGHSANDSDARLELRHSVAVEFLPSVMRKFTGGDLVYSTASRPGPCRTAASTGARSR